VTATASSSTCRMLWWTKWQPPRYARRMANNPRGYPRRAGRGVVPAIRNFAAVAPPTLA
jgi:hypothetical protein